MMSMTVRRSRLTQRLVFRRVQMRRHRLPGGRKSRPVILIYRAVEIAGRTSFFGLDQVTRDEASGHVRKERGDLDKKVGGRHSLAWRAVP
mgnify:CR=1 FL=1